MKRYSGITCEVCTTQFTPSGPAARYCKPCAVSVERLRARKKSKRARDEDPERARNAVRKWYALTKHKRKQVNQAKSLLVRYKMRPAEYQALFDAQNGRCAICGQESTRRLHVDHCHTTGRLRELLCSRCNTGIGQFRENPDYLRAAVRYVEKHNAQKGVFG